MTWRSGRQWGQKKDLLLKSDTTSTMCHRNPRGDGQGTRGRRRKESSAEGRAEKKPGIRRGELIEGQKGRGARTQLPTAGLQENNL